MPENGRSAIAKLPRRRFLSLAGAGAISRNWDFPHIPSPKYKLFQTVYSEFTPDDEERVTRYWGFIQGVIYNPQDYRSEVGWVYICRWRRIEPHDPIELTCLGECLENQLTAYAGRF